MAKLSESHERDYLELLKPYASEEHIKTRRNVVVTSFVVLSIYLLGRSLTEISVFGVKLEGSNKFSVSALALVLITYWLIMYLTYFCRDYEIQKEQECLLLSGVQKVKARMDEMQVNIDAVINKEGGIIAHWKAEFDTAKSYYTIYENQLNRTKNAGVLNVVLKKVECWLPVFLAEFALLSILILQ